MDPGPDIEGHRHAATGSRWLDVTLGVGAVVISLVSLVLAIQHGAVMERVVHENARMVQSSSWPYVTLSDSNGDEQGRSLYVINLRNNGVGPARIKDLSFWYRGKRQADALAMARAVAAEARVTTSGVTESDTGGVVPAREIVPLLRAMPNGSSPATIAALAAARDRIDVRVCYCSIFDDCWTTAYAGDRPEPKPVKSCPAG